MGGDLPAARGRRPGSGQFDAEIVAVTLADGTQVAKDDGPRPGTTAEVLSQLKPAFDPENGTVTAGNACRSTTAPPRCS